MAEPAAGKLGTGYLLLLGHSLVLSSSASSGVAKPQLEQRERQRPFAPAGFGSQ